MRLAGTITTAFPGAPRMNDSNQTQALKSRANLFCDRCGLRAACAATAVEPKRKGLSGLQPRRLSLAPGEVLQRERSPSRALYVVRVGALKGFTVAACGYEEISAFHFPGDLLGLSALGTAEQTSCIVALEATSVCELKLEAVEAQALREPVLQRQLLRLAAGEIAREQTLLQSLLRRNADGRIALLLLELVKRLGGAKASFSLPMTRADLGVYLGLTPETTSRRLKQMEARGWIRTRGREVTVRAPDALAELARSAPMRGSASAYN